MGELDMLGAIGYSRKARIGRLLASPLTMRRKWREEVVIMARRKGCLRRGGLYVAACCA